MFQSIRYHAEYEITRKGQMARSNERVLALAKSTVDRWALLISSLRYTQGTNKVHFLLKR
jgi:hypothetical protein